jgi:hypothetical protein
MQLNASYFIAFYSLSGVVYLAYYFGANITVLDDVQWIPILFEIVLFLILMLQLMLLATAINNNTSLEIEKIAEIRAILERLVIDWETLMDDRNQNGRGVMSLYNTTAYQYFKCLRNTHTKEEC